MIPKVSVLLAVHNGEGYIYSAINSVLSQSFKDFELLICANGCTDKTLFIIDDTIKRFENRKPPKFLFPAVKPIILPEANKSKALNHMLNYARGEFVAIQDADDHWHPDKLESQMNYAEKFDVIGGLINYIDKGVNILPQKFETEFTHEEIVKRAFSGKNPIANCTALIRTSLLKKVNGWHSNYEGIEDYELWLRLMKYTEAKFINLNEVLAYHRLHSESHFNSKPEFTGPERLKVLFNEYKIKC